MAFPIVHDVCYVKVVCNFLELGQFGSPNSKGVSKGPAWGLFGGNIVQQLRGARIPPVTASTFHVSASHLQFSSLQH